MLALFIVMLAFAAGCKHIDVYEKNSSVSKARVGSSRKTFF
jgi:hypothetical protein